MTSSGRVMLRRRTRLLGVLVALHGLGTPGITAQESDASRLQVGDSVRVRYPGALRVDAAFHGWQGELMLLGTEGVVGDWPVSVFDLSSLGLYAERTPREGFRHYAILGAVGGLFAGAAVGLVLHATGVIRDPDQPPAQIINNTLRFSGFGIVAGAIGGGVYGGGHPGVGWIQIQLPNF